MSFLLLLVSSLQQNFIIAYVFSATKLEIRADQVLPGSEGCRGGERDGGGGRGEKWPKQCIHM
jgi:hypothetical protein